MFDNNTPEERRIHVNEIIMHDTVGVLEAYVYLLKFMTYEGLGTLATKCLWLRNRIGKKMNHDDAVFMLRREIEDTL